jgi:hypothetical protein
MESQRDYRLTMLAGSPVEPDERLLEFFRYWRRVRGDRAMPSRADIDPTGMPPRLLPGLLLTDVIDGGARFRFRLVGTGAVAAIGTDLTGRHVDEVNENRRYGDYITALYRRVVACRAPVFSMSHYRRAADALEHMTQRLMCPLSRDGSAVDMVFSCQIFASASHRADFPPLTGRVPFAGICEALLVSGRGAAARAPAK